MFILPGKRQRHFDFFYRKANYIRPVPPHLKRILAGKYAVNMEETGKYWARSKQQALTFTLTKVMII